MSRAIRSPSLSSEMACVEQVELERLDLPAILLSSLTYLTCFALGSIIVDDGDNAKDGFGFARAGEANRVPLRNALRSVSRLRGTPVLGFSFPSNSSEM